LVNENIGLLRCSGQLNSSVYYSKKRGLGVVAPVNPFSTKNLSPFYVENRRYAGAILIKKLGFMGTLTVVAEI
jgi:phosphatidylserine decarboxylase